MQATIALVEQPPPIERWVAVEQAVFSVTKKLNHARLHGFIREALEQAGKGT
jgi:hypothetical protein